MTEQQWPKGWGKGAGVTHDVLKHQKGDPVNVEPGVRVFVEDTDLTLYQGDVLEVLRTLPAESVHCVVTSPPYWGLRDYGTGSWDGGDPDCDHLERQPDRRTFNNGQTEKQYDSTLQSWSKRDASHNYGTVCGKCGARRVDNQLGLEATPEEYLASMVAVFREVRRVLRRDGTCWVNMGDSYLAAQGGRQSGVGEMPAKPLKRDGRPRSRDDVDTGSWADGDVTAKMTPARGTTYLKPKDLCMIPARLALALQADGWWLRSQIVWSKPNPMPESVTDRPTTSHEFVYLLTRSPRYFFDAEAVREKTSENTHTRYAVARETPKGIAKTEGGMGHAGWDSATNGPVTARNMRSVWEIPTQPYPEAHFATYPEELVRRCILAGSSERGCCPECEAPWERQVERIGIDVPRGNEPHLTRDPGNTKDRDIPTHYKPTITTLGWEPSCYCEDREGAEAASGLPISKGEALHGHQPHPPYPAIPCTVLDPFFGSGTTGLVARKHGRRTIGIELNPEYCELAARRLQQLSLLA